MSGHNKWSQIKEKKGKEDALKSKVFSMYAKIITLEAKKAAGDRGAPGLKAAVERAKGANVPNNNIERAIKRGSGAEGRAMEEVTYEAYGPGGAAFLIEGITDNKNRTTQEIKHVLALGGGSLGAQGSVLWAFQKTAAGYAAQTTVPLPTTEQEAVQALYQALSEHEDVKDVSTNAQFS